MPNPDRIGGFSPQGVVKAARKFFVDSSNGTAIKKGDMLFRATDGRVEPATASLATNIGSTDDKLAASTAGSVVVYCDPLQEFSGQDNGGGTVSIDNSGLNCDIEANTGNAALGISGHELDFSTIATTAALTMQILQAVESPEYGVDSAGEPNADNQSWICLINEHVYHTGLAGIG